jgi:hypothetical protein
MMLAPVGQKMMHMQIYYWLLFLICDLGTMLMQFQHNLFGSGGFTLE